MGVMYRSLKTSKSSYVQRLCLVVPFGVQTRKVMFQFGKGFETIAAFSRQEGTWHSSHKQTASFHLCVYFFP